MCTLLLVRAPAGPGTVALAANRDESRARPFEPPRRGRVGERQALFPRDHLGGTWIGTNGALLVAVTNAPSRSPDPARRSRGLLVRDALAAGSAGEAERLVRRAVGRDAYNGFNLLLADAAEARVVTASDGDVASSALAPDAAHVLHDRAASPGHDLERGVEVVGLARAAAWRESPRRALEGLGDAFLAGHEPLPWTGRPACRHGQDRGTVAAALLFLDAAEPARNLFLFKKGLACEGAWDALRPPRARSGAGT